MHACPVVLLCVCCLKNNVECKRNVINKDENICLMGTTDGAFKTRCSNYVESFRNEKYKKKQNFVYIFGI